MDVLLTIHDTLLTTRGGRGFIVLFFSCFFFAVVSNVGDTMWFQPSALNVEVVRISKQARVNGSSDQDSHRRLPNALISALNVKVNAIQTSVRNDGSG